MKQRCPPGTKRIGKRCVKKCPPGQFYDKSQAECVEQKKLESFEEKGIRFIPYPLDDYREDSRIVVMMSPDDFIRVAPIASAEYLEEMISKGQDPMTLYSQESLASIKRAILAGEKIDVPYLDVDIDTCKVVSHEGRHRAFVVKQLGIKEIPVRIYYMKSNEKGQMRFIEHFGIKKTRGKCCTEKNGKFLCKLKPQH